MKNKRLDSPRIYKGGCAMKVFVFSGTIKDLKAYLKEWKK